MKTYNLSDSVKFLELDLNAYPGGIAIWGALPPVYDTTDCFPEGGIHVHARMKTGGVKVIDDTFDVVHVQFSDLSSSFVINSEDARSYNIGTILKKRLKYLRCPNCGAVHSDTGCYSVIYHQRHQCQECGQEFDDTEPSISNPIMLLKELLGDTKQDRRVVDPTDRNLVLSQFELLGGVQIWGSNPAMLWTSKKLEESGVHIHGFRKQGLLPSVDETFSFVSIDGIVLDAEMVRYFMAQQALPYLKPYLCSLNCPVCGTSHFDQFDMATTPHSIHMCKTCHTKFESPNERPLSISNPFLSIRELLHQSKKNQI